MNQVTRHIVESTGVRKPRTPLFAIPAVIHWHGLTGTQPLKPTNAIIKYFFWVGLNIFCMFAVLDILKINQDAKNITTSTETKIRGRRTVASTAVLSRHRFGVSSSDLPSLFNNQILNVMLDTKKDKSTKSAKVGTYVPEIKNMHAGSRQSVINGLFNLPINQLVHDFLIEMDAKNTAYYFILENGHFDAFSDYCRNQRKEAVV